VDQLNDNAFVLKKTRMRLTMSLFMLTFLCPLHENKSLLLRVDAEENWIELGLTTGLLLYRAYFYFLSAISIHCMRWPQHAILITFRFWAYPSMLAQCGLEGEDWGMGRG